MLEIIVLGLFFGGFDSLLENLINNYLNDYNSVSRIKKLFKKHMNESYQDYCKREAKIILASYKYILISFLLPILFVLIDRLFPLNLISNYDDFFN